MIEPILSREEIRRRARAAFNAGLTHMSCPFHEQSDHFYIWMEEFRSMKSKREQSSFSCPPFDHNKSGFFG